MLLIPAIDLRGGRTVRLHQGDFAAETHYDIAAQQLLTRYREWGASWLHVVDLDGARDGTQTNRALIEELAAAGRPRLQVGGGLRNLEAIQTLLRAGVGRAVIGSAAVTKPEQVKEWLRTLGPERITLAFDIRMDNEGVPRCAIHGWQEQSTLTLWQAIDLYAADGLKHVLCTDIAQDGALSGPNVELYKTAVRRYPQIEWQASGGIRNAADLSALAAAGAAAAISGRALLEDRFKPEELQPFLPAA